MDKIITYRLESGKGVEFNEDDVVFEGDEHFVSFNQDDWAELLLIIKQKDWEALWDKKK